LLVHDLQARLVVRGRTVLARARFLADLSDACPRHHRSMSCPQSARLQTRTLRGSPCDSRSSIPTRVGRLHTGQTTITFPTGSGVGLSITPPGVIAEPPIRLVFWIGRGFVCRFAMFRFSTITLRSFGRASMTRPCLPRSLPLRMWTRSPLRTLMFVLISQLLASEATHQTGQMKSAQHFSLQHLRSERHDFHEVLFPQLARDRAEDARAARVALVVDDHGGVLVEGNRRPVVASVRLPRADDHRLHDLALLDRALRCRLLDRSDDDVAHPRVAAVRSALDADAEQLAGTRVVQIGRAAC